MHDHSFVFIAGLHRSGTSLLFECLREHPAISGFRGTGVPEDEGQHLQSVYRPAFHLGGPGRFAFSPQSNLTELSASVTAENRHKLFAQWRPHWDLSKPWLLEKTPQNLVQTRFLQAMFPTARFLVVLRHPLAVACATQRWNRTSLHALLEHWLCAHERFEADRCQLQHAMVLHYEDFVASPQRTLEQVWHFLDLPAHAPSLQVRSDVNGKYFLKWQQLRRGRLSRHYADEMVRRFESRMNRFGYSLQAPESAVAGEPASAPRVATEASPRVARRPALSGAISRVYQDAGRARAAAFHGYKSLKRRVRQCTGATRKRRAAVQRQPAAAPQIREVAKP